MKTSSINKIDDNLAGLWEVAEQYLGCDALSLFKEEYAAKKSESLLQVMLFGSYNAGKSSMINALLMKEVAEIGDIPKTAVANSYLWNDCYLLDTPGVNAPIEHESITEAQIDRSELILFVIRQGDQDVKDVYERMFSMLARGKNIFIVYNHELSPEELVEASARLTEIMAQYANQFKVDLKRVAEIPVIPVNVKTAMKARVKGSENLAKYSGIVDFEEVFTNWLRAFDSEYHYLDRLRKFIHQCLINHLLEAISKKENGEDIRELEALQYQRDEVVRQYDLLDSQVANHVRAEVARLKPEIAGAIGHSSSKIEAESEILKLADTVLASTSDFIQQRCDEVNAELAAAINISLDVSDGSADSPVSETIEKVILQGVKSVDTETIKNGLLLLRKFKFPLVKGRWEKTLNGWAGKANWVLTAVLSVYEIYSASSEQDKLNAEQRKQTLGAHQAVESIASDISSSILGEARKVISLAREKSISALDSGITQITESCEQVTRDKERVRSLVATLDSLAI